MLNNAGIKKETYGSGKQILFAVEHQVSMGVVVAKSVGVSEGGRTIAKAGTPLTGNLDTRETAFTLANSDGSDAIGVLLHDVDVTVDDNNGTILLFGFVNTNMIDETTKGKLSAQVKKALNKITFVAC